MVNKRPILQLVSSEAVSDDDIDAALAEKERLQREFTPASLELAKAIGALLDGHPNGTCAAALIVASADVLHGVSPKRLLGYQILLVASAQTPIAKVH
jgi:hypothetical protein